MYSLGTWTLYPTSKIFNSFISLTSIQYFALVLLERVNVAYYTGEKERQVFKRGRPPKVTIC